MIRSQSPKLTEMKSMVEYVGMTRILALPQNLVHGPYLMSLKTVLEAHELRMNIADVFLPGPRNPMMEMKSSESGLQEGEEMVG